MTIDKYSLTVGDDGQILSAAWPANDTDQIIVDELPDGELSVYKYVDGEITRRTNAEIEADQDGNVEKSLYERISELEIAFDILLSGEVSDNAE